MSFHQINDPQGVLQLAKSVKNASLSRVTKAKPEPTLSTSQRDLVDSNSSTPQTNKDQIMKPPRVSRS
jgi:hypothetical protein